MGIPTLEPRDPGEYLTDREAEEAVGFIQRNKDRPFLLYLANYAVHTPIQAKPDLIADYERLRDGQGQDDPVYAAMVHSVDEAVGRVLETLEETGLAGQTIVVFTGDNGGLDRNGRPTENAPLRSGKGYAYEGGLRTPWIVRWPGVTNPGTVSNQPIASIDLLPTIAAAVGTRPPVDRPIDGIDLGPALRGEALPGRALVWHFPHYRHGPGHDPYSVIRRGDWKLIRFYDPTKTELYNLAVDLGEQNDLASLEPAMVKQLESALDDELRKSEARLPLPSPSRGSGRSVTGTARLRGSKQLKETGSRGDAHVEVVQAEFLVWSVQRVVWQTIAHQDRRDTEMLLEVPNDRDRPS